LDHRRRDSSISLRSRRIKLRPTLHVSLPTGFRTVGLALGIVLSGMLRGLLGLEFSAATGKQKAEQPAPQTAHCASLAPDGFLSKSDDLGLAISCQVFVLLGQTYARPMSNPSRNARNAYARVKQKRVQVCALLVLAPATTFWTKLRFGLGGRSSRLGLAKNPSLRTGTDFDAANVGILDMLGPARERPPRDFRAAGAASSMTVTGAAHRGGF
jgi:hypothetical protein